MSVSLILSSVVAPLLLSPSSRFFFFFFQFYIFQCYNFQCFPFHSFCLLIFSMFIFTLRRFTIASLSLFVVDALKSFTHHFNIWFILVLYSGIFLLRLWFFSSFKMSDFWLYPRYFGYYYMKLCILYNLLTVAASPLLRCTSGGSLVPKSCSTLATPWAIAYQATLSMKFSGQKYWSGVGI